jgi:hypothetical protein
MLGARPGPLNIALLSQFAFTFAPYTPPARAGSCMDAKRTRNGYSVHGRKADPKRIFRPVSELARPNYSYRSTQPGSNVPSDECIRTFWGRKDHF